MLTRRALGLALVVCLLPAAPAPAAPPERPASRVWLLRRSGTPARPLSATVRLISHDEYGAATIVGVTRRGRHRDLNRADDTSYVELGGHSAWPYVYVNRQPAGPIQSPDCPDAVLCTEPGLLAQGFEMRIDDPGTSERDYYVAAVNLDVEIVASAGWMVRELTGDPATTGGLTLHQSREHDANGVRWNHRAVEHFRFARAPGGRFGSIAFASIPCLPTGLGVRTGIGAAALLGGDGFDDRRAMDCGFPSARGAARGPTVWRNVGDVVGYGTPLHRLAVFDLPRP